MKIVVDTNILFTFFWKRSTFDTLSLKKELHLLAPEYAIEEIRRYEEDIKKKANISQKEFEERIKELVFRVEFIPLEEYARYIKNIMHVADSFPIHEREEILKDIDFLALALKEECPLWTHDKLLTQQSQIKTVATKDLIEIL